MGRGLLLTKALLGPLLVLYIVELPLFLNAFLFAKNKNSHHLDVGVSPLFVSLSSSSSAAAATAAAEQQRQRSLTVGLDPLLSLNLNLDALARADASDRAQELYSRIAALHTEGYYAQAPDVVSFNSVLKACQNDPQKALEFFKTQLETGEIVPNVRSYNTVLLSLAKAGLYQEAEHVLLKMKQTADVLRSQILVVPDRITYNTVMLAHVNAIATKKHYKGPLRAEELLKEMLNSTDTSPDAVSFNTVISAWAQYAALLQRNNRRRKKDDANDDISISAALAATKAEDWLQEMKQYRGSGVQPDIYSYTTVIQCWATSCYSCSAGEESEQSANRAWKLLQFLRNSKAVQPNKITYTIVFQALCRNQQVDRAQRVLEDLLLEQRQHQNLPPEQQQHKKNRSGVVVRPDCVMFSVLMEGWSNVAAERPQEAVNAVLYLLEQMQELAASQKQITTWPEEDVRPNSITYTSVLKTLALSQLSNASAIAEDLVMNQMKQQFGVEPGVIHYNAAINCCAKSPLVDKMSRAHRLYKHMLDNNVPTDIITYNVLLATAANSFGSPPHKEVTLRTALALFSRLVVKDNEQTHCPQATSLTYYYLLKAIRRLLPDKHPEKLKLLQRAFEHCCNDGCLNGPILQQVQQYLSNNPKRHHLFFGNDDNTATHDDDDNGKKIRRELHQLPSAWSRCAMKSRQRRLRPEKKV